MNAPDASIAIPETATPRKCDVALNLMTMALALLDREGGDAGIIACHLQEAIDLRVARNESKEVDHGRADRQRDPVDQGSGIGLPRDPGRDAIPA
jgi:hypothetical protein